jgi:hypothetical protein
MNRLAFRGVAALAVALALTPAWAGGKTGLSQAQQDHRQERARAACAGNPARTRPPA